MARAVGDGRPTVLAIRREQLGVLEADAGDAFTNKMIGHLRRNFVHEVRTQDDDELRAFIVAGIEKAARYDVLFAADVARFIGYMAYWGVEFDRDPRLAWVMIVLRDETLDGAAKMDAMDAHGSS